uniref:glycosyltransferase family 2 protein n=1 Tax=Castellaniella defragrans TaxID=75697 RepID=UPI00334064C8
MPQPYAIYAALTPPASTATAPQPSVAILLATYQGERYLPEQLDSFARQTYSNWKAWASDDGSTDDTLPILRRYQTQWAPGQLTIIKGPAQGSSRNFVSLTHNPAIQADYYAYSDQDDIWEDDKLARALAWLNTQDADKPALYCTRTRLVDAQNKEIGLSPNFRRPPSFANALMQNITGGNTMVFNNAACRLLRSVPEDTEIVIHDWWVYLVVTACGGAVCFDPVPGLRYRQHENNLIGMSAGGPPLVSRIAKLFGTTLRENSDIHLKALQILKQHMTPENRCIMEIFSKARANWLLPRLAGYKKAGVYRLTFTGNIGMVIASVLNRL